MIVGVDFDNTIVAYDALFHRVAFERGLIPKELPVNKTAVRDHLRATNREDIWTEMQGEVYGARMSEADAYPGVLGFFQSCRDRGLRVVIISHKTRHPYRGELHDLHASARGWLRAQGFFDPARIGLNEDQVFFELTKGDKIARIAACGCTHFIDDLPELLTEPTFPENTQRFLFDSQNVHTCPSNLRSVTTWNQLSAEVLGTESWTQVAAQIAADHGLPYATQPLPLQGGANNRVFRLGEKTLVKRYFSHPGDLRDRFATERAFYRYAQAAGVRQMPRALGWDERENLGVFTFIEGRSPTSAEMPYITDAMQFFAALNHNRDTPEAHSLPTASEACFSIEQHLATTQRRVEMMLLPSQDSLDIEAQAFVDDTLRPAWAATEAALRSEFDPTAFIREMRPSERCVSPSDFGFHNSLLTPTDELFFVDFEYAGWDDPAKLIGDFFCQPDVPVSLAHFDLVLNSVAATLNQDDHATFAAKCRILLPVYQIKWSCILLNEFTRAGRDRRVFSLGADVATARRQRQLTRARQMLSTISLVA